MPRILRNFEGMWNTYPHPGGSAEAVKRTIGGNVDADWITNTCVIRVSRSFNYSNHRIPRTRAGLTTVSGADGLRYAFRVREFRRYLSDVYGPPDLHHVYPRRGGPVPADFRGKQGVIGFLVEGWSDATGHFDLWKNDRCIHTAYFDRASEVLLWTVSSETSTGRPQRPIASLTASVGSRGANRPDDVARVQRLLVEHGVDPGPVDGLSGPRTRGAIRTFQKRFLTRPDGRVDVDGRTWRELLRL